MRSFSDMESLTERMQWVEMPQETIKSVSICFHLQKWRNTAARRRSSRDAMPVRFSWWWVPSTAAWRWAAAWSGTTIWAATPTSCRRWTIYARVGRAVPFICHTPFCYRGSRVLTICPFTWQPATSASQVIVSTVVNVSQWQLCHDVSWYQCVARNSIINCYWRVTDNSVLCY